MRSRKYSPVNQILSEWSMRKLSIPASGDHLPLDFPLVYPVENRQTPTGVQLYGIVLLLQDKHL